MKKIMFITPSFVLFRNLGVMQLSSIFKEHGVLVDIGFFEDLKLEKKIAVAEPDMLGFSMMTPDHQRVLALIARLKRAFPQITMVVGGQHPTYNPEIINCEGVDVVVRGEADLVIPDLIETFNGDRNYGGIANCVTKEGSTPLRDLIVNLDQLPFADRQIGINPKTFQDIGHFILSRGCPFACSYCFNHIWNELYKDKGRVFRTRSVESCLTELEAAKANLRFIIFWDDCFTLRSTEWLQEFAQGYRQRVGIPFTCMMRANTVTEEKIAALHEAGCKSTYMAIEAGSDRVRNKLACRAMDKETILKANRLVQKYGINVCAENIIGFPTETLAEMKETILLNVESRVDVAVFSILTPYPGTTVHKLLCQNSPGGESQNLSYSKDFFTNEPIPLYTAAERRQIQNLQALSVLFVCCPRLLKTYDFLLALPLTRLYRFINMSISGWLMKNKMFPYKLGFGGWCRQAFRYLTTQRNQ